MVTFNADSLDFADEEEARFGTDSNFGISYDSGTDALAIQDRINSALAEVPRGTDADLIGGKFAQTLDEGKVLNDAGNVYESIQQAQDEAQSWVKVGPGQFRESVTIDTAGLTLEGSGERTTITEGIFSSASDVIVKNLSTESDIDVSGSNTEISSVTISIELKSQETATNLTVINSTMSEFAIRGNRTIISNCSVDGGNEGNFIICDDTIISRNIIKNMGGDGIQLQNDGNGDNIVISNRIINSDNNGILIGSGQTDCIVANNRISNSGSSSIDNIGGALLDANLTT